MKKIIIFFLFMVCINAYAENWKLVIESDNADYYVDEDSIIKHRHLTRAWVLFNYSESAIAPGTKFSFISDKSLFFFDCKKRKFGRTTQILYTKPNAMGESLMTYSGKISDIKYEKMEAGTVGENLLNFVCNHVLFED